MSTFLQEYFLVFTLQFVALIMPGPDNILVMSNATMHSRKHGIYTGLGISLGVCIQMTACILGLGLIFKESPLLFQLVTYLSAAYLLFLGAKILYQTWRHITESKSNGKSLGPITHYYQAFVQGLLCNILNPKAILFFLGLFTLVIDEHTPSTWQIIYGVTIVLSAVFWFTSMSILITHPKGKIYVDKIQHILQPLFGALLIVYSILIVVTI